jgi:hypothetical protein
MSRRDPDDAMTQLPADEFTAFAQWFEEFLADTCHRRIEADIRAGRLDEAGRQANANFDAGLARALNGGPR